MSILAYIPFDVALNEANMTEAVKQYLADQQKGQVNNG